MTGTSKGRKATLGVRCHSGWAAVILLCGSRRAFEVLERRRVDLCDPAIEGSKQPFHAAEHKAISDAEGFIARCRTSTNALARSALLDIAMDQRLRIVGCGLLCASGRPLPALKGILESHALIHTAEGEFYRDAVAHACEAAKLKVIRVREREVLRQASDATGVSEEKLKERLTGLGKLLGPPWTQDEKLSTLAALVALA